MLDSIVEKLFPACQNPERQRRDQGRLMDQLIRLLPLAVLTQNNSER
jgi:hypothetical protein